MSNPITAICAAYLAYKAHDIEPIATIGKVCFVYKIFKFLNNLCYDRDIDRGTDFGTTRLLGRAISFFLKSAHSCTTAPDGSITYTYRLGRFKKPASKTDSQIDYLAKLPLEANWTRTETWTRTDSTLTKLCPAIIAAAAFSLYYLMPTQATPASHQSALFNPANDTIHLYKTNL